MSCLIVSPIAKVTASRPDEDDTDDVVDVDNMAAVDDDGAAVPVAVVLSFC